MAVARSFADEILACEKRYWAAIKKKDGAEAVRLSYDPCVITDSSGVREVDHKSLARRMTEGSWSLDQFELEDVKVKRLGDEVAIVAYKVREKMTVDGKPVEFEAVDASTWIFDHGAWRCALHSEAVRGDAIGR